MKHFLAALAILIASTRWLAAADAVRPNVLIILSDDQGYADAGFQGGTEAPTPHLDALAKSGVRCTSGYVTHSFCSPTRAALLTGRYQQRFGHENNPVYDPLDPAEGLPLSERLLPQYMKDAGYVTGWVGKWHLGASTAHSPWKRGFDETFGFIGGGHRFANWLPNERQYTLPLVHNGESSAEVPPHLTEALGNEASAFIRRHTNQPWMLYLAFNAPHTPHEPTIARMGKFAHVINPARRKYLAQLSLMDDAVGSVIASLGEADQTKRTLVFFFSDNGGHEPSGSDNGPLRGQKGTLYEGGVRVPFIVSWPGKLPAGTVFDAPVSSLDVFATALSVAGGSVPAEKKIDGVNLVPFLAGESKTAPHERLFWRMSNKQTHAIREGSWKLIRQQGAPAELFNLSADMGEEKNVASENVELAARLGAALDAWDKELVPPAFPGSTVKNEDWGPGGANQKGGPNKGRPDKAVSPL